jgi:hypothetical protein
MVAFFVLTIRPRCVLLIFFSVDSGLFCVLAMRIFFKENLVFWLGPFFVRYFSSTYNLSVIIFSCMQLHIAV